MHPDRRVVGRVAVGRDRVGLGGGRHRDRGRLCEAAIGRGRAAVQAELPCEVVPGHELVIGVGVAVVLVGDREQASGEAGQAAGHERERLRLFYRGDRASAAECETTEAGARGVVDAQFPGADIRREQVRRVVRLVECEALDLLLEGAERRHGVELHRRGVGLRFGRDAPEPGGFDDDVQCL